MPARRDGALLTPQRYQCADARLTRCVNVTRDRFARDSGGGPGACP